MPTLLIHERRPRAGIKSIMSSPALLCLTQSRSLLIYEPPAELALVKMAEVLLEEALC
jgi:hypothetical protein